MILRPFTNSPVAIYPRKKMDLLALGYPFGATIVRINYHPFKISCMQTSHYFSLAATTNLPFTPGSASACSVLIGRYHHRPAAPLEEATLVNAEGKTSPTRKNQTKNDGDLMQQIESTSATSTVNYRNIEK